MIAIRPAHSRVLSLVAALAACLVATSPAQGQTYTSPGGQTFTNIVGWNFAQGPVPFSDPNNLLTIRLNAQLVDRVCGLILNHPAVIDTPF